MLNKDFAEQGRLLCVKSNLKSALILFISVPRSGSLLVVDTTGASATHEVQWYTL